MEPKCFHFFRQTSNRDEGVSMFPRYQELRLPLFCVFLVQYHDPNSSGKKKEQRHGNQEFFLRLTPFLLSDTKSALQANPYQH